MKRSLFKAAILIIVFLTATSLFPSQALADKTITIRGSAIYDRQYIVANFTVEKGTEIAYSFNASDVVYLSVTGHETGDPQVSHPLVCFLQIVNASVNGTFIAPFDGYTYRFTFRDFNISNSVQVTYDFHVVKPPLSLGILLLLMVTTLAIIGFIGALFLARHRAKKQSKQL